MKHITIIGVDPKGFIPKEIKISEAIYKIAKSISDKQRVYSYNTHWHPDLIADDFEKDYESFISKDKYENIIIYSNQQNILLRCRNMLIENKIRSLKFIIVTFTNIEEDIIYSTQEVEYDCNGNVIGENNSKLFKGTLEETTKIRAHILDKTKTCI